MTVYLDHAAGQPLRPAAREAILAAWDALGGQGANPSAAHRAGRAAADLLFSARERVAHLVGAATAEIVFTAGGTEADAIAVRGALAADRAAGGAARAVITGLEHPAVAENAAACAGELDVIPVDPSGAVDMAAAETILSSGVRPALVSLVAVASETGALTPIRELTALVRERWGGEVVVHVDAVQAAGRIEVDAGKWGVDCLSLAGHKIGAPPATGALYVSRSCSLLAPILGGGQERGLRSGTQDVALAQGFAVALSEAETSRAETMARHDAFQERLCEGISELEGVSVATNCPRVSSITMLTCEGAPAEPLVFALDVAGVAASAGSACHTGVTRPSPALLAQGLSEEVASSSLRVSMGWSTSASDIEGFIDALPGALETARRFARRRPR